MALIPKPFPPLWHLGQFSETNQTASPDPVDPPARGNTLNGGEQTLVLPERRRWHRPLGQRWKGHRPHMFTTRRTVSTGAGSRRCGAVTLRCRSGPALCAAKRLDEAGWWWSASIVSHSPPSHTHLSMSENSRSHSQRLFKSAATDWSEQSSFDNNLHWFAWTQSLLFIFLNSIIFLFTSLHPSTEQPCRTEIIHPKNMFDLNTHTKKTPLTIYSILSRGQNNGS